jgi:arylformamidase
MVTWPGDPDVIVEVQPRSPAGGQVSALQLGSHTGTHVDAPLHFIEGGAGIDRMPPDTLIGPARVVEVSGDVIDAAALRDERFTAGARVLFRTRNSGADRSGFDEHYVALTRDAAACLADAGVACVGVDYLSVATRRDDAAAVHRELLARGVWIIEGLDLSAAPAGEYHLVCLPLRVAGGDGAPARAILGTPGEVSCAR